MSEESKHPMDRPLTGNDLYLIFEGARQYDLRDALDDYINRPRKPKPQPKDDELWLCKDDDLGLVALWRKAGKWFSGNRQGRVCGCQNDAFILPIKRLIPQEDINE